MTTNEIISSIRNLMLDGDEGLVLSEAADRLATLQALLSAKTEQNEALKSLVSEVKDLHSNPFEPEYNACESWPCHWCEQAKKLLDPVE